MDGIHNQRFQEDSQGRLVIGGRVSDEIFLVSTVVHRFTKTFLIYTGDTTFIHSTLYQFYLFLTFFMSGSSHVPRPEFLSTTDVGEFLVSGVVDWSLSSRSVGLSFVEKYEQCVATVRIVNSFGDKILTINHQMGRHLSLSSYTQTEHVVTSGVPNHDRYVLLKSYLNNLVIYLQSVVGWFPSFIKTFLEGERFLHPEESTCIFCTLDSSG